MNVNFEENIEKYLISPDGSYEKAELVKQVFLPTG